MWWRTACPNTRSKLPSPNGSSSASQTVVSTSSSSIEALASSTSIIPGEMSVQVAWPTIPAMCMWSEKYPVPAPISSERAKVGISPPRAFSTFPRTWSRPIWPQSIPHLAS